MCVFACLCACLCARVCLNRFAGLLEKPQFPEECDGPECGHQRLRCSRAMAAAWASRVCCQSRVNCFFWGEAHSGNPYLCRCECSCELVPCKPPFKGERKGRKPQLNRNPPTNLLSGDLFGFVKEAMVKCCFRFWGKRERNPAHWRGSTF